MSPIHDKVIPIHPEVPIGSLLCIPGLCYTPISLLHINSIAWGNGQSDSTAAFGTGPRNSCSLQRVTGSHFLEHFWKRIVINFTHVQKSKWKCVLPFLFHGVQRIAVSKWLRIWLKKTTSITVLHFAYFPLPHVCDSAQDIQAEVTFNAFTKLINLTFQFPWYLDKY